MRGIRLAETMQCVDNEVIRAAKVHRLTMIFGRQAPRFIIRRMMELLAFVEHAALGEIIKKIISGALSWAKNRKEPTSDLVELKLSKLAIKNLPESLPEEQKQAAAATLVELVKPTFEQIVEYSPTTQKIISATRRRPLGPGPTWHARRAPAKHAAKKAPAKKAAKKATAKKAPAKKATAKRAAARF
jgi:hypothetical protein